MSVLKDTYDLKIRFQRSTRVDADLSPEFLDGLVFHGTAQNTLKTIYTQYSKAKHKTFTLTGPYGSGKSTIALLLSALLSDNKLIHSTAKSVVGKEFYNSFRKSLPTKKGWLQVKVVGGVRDPIAVLKSATKDAIEPYKALISKPTIAAIESISNEVDFLDAFETLSKALSPHVDGILFIYDELGKTLEHISLENGDLHLFQDLAELLNRLDTNALFIGLLHQAFSEYASGRSTKTQAEWAKVQGRYTDLLYQVSPDETVTLIASSITTKHPEPEYISARNKDLADYLACTRDTKLAGNLSILNKFEKLGPLDPFVAILLGVISKRRFCQNERSVFGFLSSHEPNSFADFLSDTLEANQKFYGLSELWDFMHENLDMHISASPDSRAWLQAKDAVQRTSTKCAPATVAAIKCIALINLFGRQVGLYADKGTICLANGLTNKQTKDVFSELEKNSIIILRKHLNAWAIFEGSDINLHELAEDRAEKLALTEDWLKLITLPTVQIAKAHHQKTGVLRWLDFRLFKNQEELEKHSNWQPNKREIGSFAIVLNGPAEQVPNTNWVVGKFPNTDLLQNAANELLALKQIDSDVIEIQHDNVAKEELKLRLSAAETALLSQIETGLQKIEWIWAGAPVKEASISQIASKVADYAYSQCPPILNELINRKRPSGSSVAARKKLMYRMIDPGFQIEKNLALEGFPPERMIYLTCIRELGLHCSNGDGNWKFSLPEIQGNLSKIGTLISAIDKFVNNAHEMVTIKAIYDFMAARPYGITEGVAPILVLAFLLAKDGEYAYYDKDSSGKFMYMPDLDEQFVDKMMRAPAELGVRYFEVEGVNKSILSELSKFASKEFGGELDDNALEVARPLVTFAHGLPPWVKTTRSLSDQTISLRNALLKATDPFQLIFVEFENLFGLSKLKSSQRTKVLNEKLHSALEDLKTVHTTMLQSKKNVLISHLGQLDDSLIERARRVQEFAADFKLQAFAQRLTGFESNGSKWLEAIISLVTGTATRDWNDTTLRKCDEQLYEYCQRFKRTELFSSTGDASTTSYSVALVSGKPGASREFNKQLHVGEVERKAAQEIKIKLEEQLKDQPVDAKVFALHEMLAELLDEIESQGTCEVTI